MLDDAIPERWRLAGIGAALAFFLLVSAAIHVSTFEVHYGTRIWFAHEVEAGAQAAIRIGVLERPGGAPVPGATARIGLSSRDDRGEGGAKGLLELGMTEAGDTGYMEEILAIPEDLPPGSYELVVEVESPSHPDEVVALPVEVVPPQTLSKDEWVVVRPVCEESSSRKADGGWHRARRCTRETGGIHLYPENGHLIAHVDGPLHVWRRPAESAPSAAEESEKSPLPPTLEVLARSPVVPGETVRESRLGRVTLDSLGLGTIQYEPPFPRGSLVIREGEEEERIWLRDLPAQFGARVQRRLLSPGEMLQLELWTRRPNLPVFLDLLLEGTWAGAYSGRVEGREERLGVPLPQGFEGLVIVRASLSPNGVGAVTTAAWVSSKPGGPAASELAGELASAPQAEPLASYLEGTRPRDSLIEWAADLEPELMEALSEREAERLAAAMLSRVEAGARSSPLLADTTGEKLLALDEWKAAVRRPILFGLAAIALMALGIGGWLTLSYQRRVRRRIEALDLEEIETDEATGSMTGSGWLVPGAALLIVLVAAAISLLVFLETLRWGRGDIFSAYQRESAEQVMENER